jgi:hypothetical protein
MSHENDPYPSLTVRVLLLIAMWTVILSLVLGVTDLLP